MRYFITIIFALTFSLGYAAFPQEAVDTVAALENATDIIVTRLDGVTKVQATYEDEDGLKTPFIYEVNVEDNDSVEEIELKDNWILNPPFTRRNINVSNNRNRIRRDMVCFEHMYAGWRFNYGQNGKVKNFFEVGIRQLVGMEWSKGQRNKSTFSVGLGMGIRIFKAQKGFAYTKEADRLVLFSTPVGQKVKSSWLTMPSFQVPLIYKQNFANDFNFSIGGILNFNTYAVALTEITEDKVKFKTRYNGLQQNFLTPEIYAFLGIWDVGVYFTWSPVSLFSKNYGPQLRGLSIGIEMFSF